MTVESWERNNVRNLPKPTHVFSADLRIAAVGKLFTLIALAGIVAVRRVWQPFDVALTCKPGVAAVHVRPSFIYTCITA
jgi:hypothetical protein